MAGNTDMISKYVWMVRIYNLIVYTKQNYTFNDSVDAQVHSTQLLFALILSLYIHFNYNYNKSTKCFKGTIVHSTLFLDCCFRMLVTISFIGSGNLIPTASAILLVRGSAQIDVPF